MPFDSWTDMARIVPTMLRLKSYRTVYGFVSTYIRDERLRVVLSFHPLLIGGNPFTTTSIYCLIAFLERRWGVHFAMGGTGRLVQGLVGLIEGQGGSLRCASEVTEILAQDRIATGVRLASGRNRRRRYRGVERRLGLDLQEPLAQCRAQAAGPIAGSTRARYSMSLFVWYFGTRRRYQDVAHHTILLGPRYRGAARGHLRAQGAGRGLQPVPASADRDRSVAGAARLRCVLRAVAGAAPAEWYRLVEASRALSQENRAGARATHPARVSQTRS